VLLRHVDERQPADLEIVVHRVEPRFGAGPDDLVRPRQLQLEPDDARQGNSPLDELLHPQPRRAEVHRQGPKPAVADVLVQEELHANA